MTFQPVQPTDPQPAPTVQPINPFRDAPRADLVRDGAAIVLLLAALFYRWDAGNTAASRWWVDIATVLALAGLVVPYLGYAGVFGSQWQAVHGRLVRVGAAVPYVISLLALLIVDLINSGGSDYGYDGGVGRAAHIGVFAIILALQSRAREGQRTGGEDTVWFGATLGLLTLGMVATVGSSITLIGNVGSAAVLFVVLAIVAAVAALALMLVGVSRRDAAWTNVVIGLGVTLLTVDILGLQSASSIGLRGVPAYLFETSHGAFFGVIFIIGAAAAALSPGVGDRLRPDVARRTAMLSLLILAAFAATAAFYLLTEIVSRSEYGGGTSIATIFVLILSLLIAGVTALGGLLAKQQPGPALLLGATGAYAALSFIVAIISASSDQMYASGGTWVTPLIVALALALLVVGGDRLKPLIGGASTHVADPAPSAEPVPATQPEPAVPHQASSQNWGTSFAPAASPAPPAPPPLPEAPSVEQTAVQPQLDEWQLRAGDPSTPATELAHLAEHYPQTRAAVAAHPLAYPGLLSWLSEFGDPQIDAAIRGRSS